MNTIYTIVRNESNEVMFTTNDFEIVKKYVKNHFPKYEINDKYNMIVLYSKNFTFNKTELNYSVFDGEYYEQ